MGMLLLFLFSSTLSMFISSSSLYGIGSKLILSINLEIRKRDLYQYAHCKVYGLIQHEDHCKYRKMVFMSQLYNDCELYELIVMANETSSHTFAVQGNELIQQ